MKKELNPFERWMVKSNLVHVQAEGLAPVVARLRAQGYERVANAVEAVGQAKSVEASERFTGGGNEFVFRVSPKA